MKKISIYIIIVLLLIICFIVVIVSITWYSSKWTINVDREKCIVGSNIDSSMIPEYGLAMYVLSLEQSENIEEGFWCIEQLKRIDHDNVFFRFSHVPIKKRKVFFFGLYDEESFITNISESCVIIQKQINYEYVSCFDAEHGVLSP